MTPSAVSGEDNVALFLRRMVRELQVLVAVLDQQFRVRALLEVWLLRGVVLLAVLVLLELLQLDGFEQVLLGKRTESPCWRWSAPGSVGDARVDAARWLRSGAARKEDGKSSLALNSGGASTRQGWRPCVEPAGR